MACQNVVETNHSHMIAMTLVLQHKVQSKTAKMMVKMHLRKKVRRGKKLKHKTNFKSELSHRLKSEKRCVFEQKKNFKSEVSQILKYEKRCVFCSLTLNTSCNRVSVESEDIVMCTVCNELFPQTPTVSEARTTESHSDLDRNRNCVTTENRAYEDDCFNFYASTDSSNVVLGKANIPEDFVLDNTVGFESFLKSEFENEYSVYNNLQICNFNNDSTRL